MHVRVCVGGIAREKNSRAVLLFQGSLKQFWVLHLWSLFYTKMTLWGLNILDLLDICLIYLIFAKNIII